MNIGTCYHLKGPNLSKIGRYLGKEIEPRGRWGHETIRVFQVPGMEEEEFSVADRDFANIDAVEVADPAPQPVAGRSGPLRAFLRVLTGGR